MPKPDVGTMLGKCSTYSAMNLSVIFRDRPNLVRPSWDRLTGFYEAGLLMPFIGARFPLAAVGEAHTLMESRGSTGKILLLP
jgi:NADPH2:quinone reductase